MSRWNPSDDAKLTALWTTPHSGADSTKLDIASVKAVHAKHFSDKKYSNFAPLYRNKARAFNVAKTLDGHRKSRYPHNALYPLRARVSFSPIVSSQEAPKQKQQRLELICRTSKTTLTSKTSSTKKKKSLTKRKKILIS